MVAAAAAMSEPDHRKEITAVGSAEGEAQEGAAADAGGTISTVLAGTEHSTKEDTPDTRDTTATATQKKGGAYNEGGEVGLVAKTVRRVRRKTRVRPATGEYDFKRDAIDWADL